MEELRLLVHKQLTGAAEDIFGLFKATIEEYEVIVSRLLEENKRQRTLLEDRGARLHEAVVQQLLVVKEEVSSEQHIEEEQEKLWSSQKKKFPEMSESPKGQQQSLPYIFKVFSADVPQIKEEQEELQSYPAGSVPVKSADDEEKAPSSQLHQTQAEGDREAESPASSSAQQMETDTIGGSEAALTSDSDKTSASDETEDSDDYCKKTPPKPSKFLILKDNKVVRSEPPRNVDQACEDKTSDSSDDETEDSEDDRVQERPLGSKTLKTKEAPARSSQCQTQKTPFICSVCDERFHLKQQLSKHMNTHSGHSDKHTRSHTRERVSKKCDSGSLKHDKKPNAEGTSFMCFICDRRFKKRAHMTLHMRVHKVKSSNC